jgi:hypothetical protein
MQVIQETGRKAALFEGVDWEEESACLDWNVFVFGEIEAGGVTIEETFVFADFGGIEDTASPISLPPFRFRPIHPRASSLRRKVTLDWICTHGLVSCLAIFHSDFINMASRKAVDRAVECAKGSLWGRK